MNRPRAGSVSFRGSCRQATVRIPQHALRCERCDSCVRPSKHLPIGFVRRESGELIDQHDDGGAVRPSHVLTRNTSESTGPALHLGDRFLEQSHRVRRVIGEPGEKIPTHRQLHSALAINPPDFDEPLVDRLRQSEK